MTRAAAVLLVAGDEPRERWHEVRDGGVTASDAHAVANGSRETHEKILDGKLNGASFRGSRATERGHEREPYLMHHAATIAPCSPTSALYGHPENLRIMATPDGSGRDEEHGPFGVEVKSHDHNWTRGTIPPEHYDQMQVGMYVRGFDWWLYVWEVLDEDGEPSGDDPQHRWVPRDEVRIARLVAEADAFNAWRDAGAPPLDGLTAEEDELLTAEAADAAEESAVKKRRAERKPAVVAFLNGRSADATVRASGTRASITRTAEVVRVLDVDAWRVAEPAVFAEHEEALQIAVDATERAQELAAAALDTFHKTETKYGSVRIATIKEKSK